VTRRGAPTLGGAWPGPIPVTPREFRLLQALIEREAGIHLSEVKKPLVTGRLSRRLRDLGLRSFTEYYDLVTARDGRPERLRMVEAICTHETHFFREPQHFRFLEERVIPEWKDLAAAARRPRRISVWSAACSTGEEPYSIAMHLLAHFPPESGWAIDVLATDLSPRVVERAAAGVWPVERSAEIPVPYLKRFMLKGTGPEAGKMKASVDVRAVIRFGCVNLSAPPYSAGVGFDLIFCRNVLIYFAAGVRRDVILRLVDHHLDPAGYLFLGHAETVHGLTNRLRSVGSTVYAPSGSPAEGRPR
jgi:chemotaxis protein methyltransferase CheR